MRNLFIVPIEKIGTRYTTHWFKYLPKQLAEFTNYNVHQFELPQGDDAPQNSEGGFFNFGFTCSYKSQQLVEIEKQFDSLVKDGDVFLFTDYWNPAVFFLRYIAAMKKVKITIVGICHAGLWDKEDMLSKAFGEEKWGLHLETAFGSAYDHLIFATDFSRNLYMSKINADPWKLHATGFPMEYYDKFLADYWSEDADVPEKENIVVFPHRKAEEKRIDYFKEIEQIVHQVKNRKDISFVVALDVCKDKTDYHALLYRSKVAFSAATQETLGISMGIEAPICGCIPMVPNRLSYRELFAATPEFFFSDREEDKSETADRVIEFIDNYDKYQKSVKLHRNLARHWFDGYRFYSFLNTL